MASQWTDKYAILRDLSLAQGREVPVEIENTIAHGEKPPALNYIEDTEEEFFENCVGDGDYNMGPDLPLIQQMLEMVREVDISQGSGDGYPEPEQETVVTKGSQAPSIKIMKKPKRQRNVALASLNKAYGENTKINNVEVKEIVAPKLLRPEDFVVDTTVSDCVTNVTDKVNGWLDENAKISSSLSPVSPGSMFKKKSPSKLVLESGGMFRKKHSTNTSSENSTTKPEKVGNFVPSSHAGEYYQKYLERSKIQEQVKEDIWVKAERQMKEIEEKRKEELLLSPVPSSQISTSTDMTGIEAVSLPQHRHLLGGDCVVCEKLCVRKDTDKDESDNII